MNAANWPYNINSKRVDPDIKWMQSAVPLKVNAYILREVPVESWQRLMSTINAGVWRDVDEETRAAITEYVTEGTLPTAGVTVLSPTQVTTMAARALEIESARAQIPVEGLICMMLNAIQTGDLNGIPLQSKDRVDMMKFLINKSLPDAKNVDMDDRGRNFDQKKRTADSFSTDELKKMTREELIALSNS